MRKNGANPQLYAHKDEIRDIEEAGGVEIIERGAAYDQEKLQTCSAKYVSFEANK
ncbi:MAG: hypothetical protein ACOYOE_07685 [Chlorobium sp.]